MPGPHDAQTNAGRSVTPVIVGVDVGGTFTDLVAWDGQSLNVVKVPSTPPHFERAVIEAVERAAGDDPVHIVHGSTVATNALLQRHGEPIAFITTEGFRDLLLIGRQNRPKLYALRVERPAPIAPPEHCFTVRERIDAAGNIVTPLDEAGVDQVITRIRSLGLRHVAVCLLFSFVNAEHEQRVGAKCEAAGLTVSLSSDLLPEFREYERASTVAVNATLRPVVAAYLSALEEGIGERPLRVMHSAGGTLPVAAAAAQAVRLVLSGPAGGVIGAAYVAKAAGFPNAITYDMGGTSTDVAVILDGAPQWTTRTVIDGLPIGVPMFDIHTVGAGGGSVAYVDAGGALRVGPRSAGANPGPACYGRGGAEPTVTDANLLLGRIVPDQFLGGAMRIDADLAGAAIAPLATQLGKSESETALGILRVAEANMAAAIRAVTSRRGHDPRDFALVSFGGAGGLHACALADALDVPRVLVPPYCGVLSALGMVVAPPVVDASRTVIQLGGGLDDHRLIAEIGHLNGITSDSIPYEQTGAVEVYADVRFRGQSHEVTVRLYQPTTEHAQQQFLAAYAKLYGRAPEGRPIEIVTLRVRRYGRSPHARLPSIQKGEGDARDVMLVDEQGNVASGRCLTRASLVNAGKANGPLLIVDPEATAYVPRHWTVEVRPDGNLILERV